MVARLIGLLTQSCANLSVNLDSQLYSVLISQHCIQLLVAHYCATCSKASYSMCIDNGNLDKIFKNIVPSVCIFVYIKLVVILFSTLLEFNDLNRQFESIWRVVMPLPI